MDRGVGKDLVELRRGVSLKLAFATRQLRRHFDQGVSQLGVTRSQWTVITSVSRNPGATQRWIAAALEISEASAGRLVDRLCAEGLLERRPKDDDRRAHCVFLTKAGEAITTRLGEIASINEETAFGGFDTAELELLDRLIGRILRNLGKP